MRYTLWHRVGIVSSAVVLALPLAAAPAPAATTVVDVGSTIDLGWNSAPVEGRAEAVDGRWAVGWSYVDGPAHAFASDLYQSPPTVADLGTLGGASSYANDVSGSWAVGWSMAADGENHAFAVDLSAAEPEMIDLHPDGMASSLARSVDGPWVVGDAVSPMIDGVDYSWGAAWKLTDATVADPPEPIQLLPLGTDSYVRAYWVSGDRVVGESEGADGVRRVAWSLSGATAGEQVAAVELPALPDDVATVYGVGGQWAVGSSSTGTSGTPVVWDLTQTSPSPVALPLSSTDRQGVAMAADGTTVAGYEEVIGTNRRFPVVWNMSTTPPIETFLPTFAGTPDEYGTPEAIDGDWVVGYSAFGAPSNETHAFAYNLDTSGPLLDLGSLKDYSMAVDVSGTWVVGTSSVDVSGHHATAWNLLTPARPVLADPVSGDASIALTWTAPGYTAGADVTGYTVAYQATGDTAWTTRTPSPATDTSLTVGSLANGTTYQFKVQASTANGLSAYSVVKTAATAAKPEAPSAPVATKTRAGIALTWTDNGTGGATITDHQVKVYTYTKATKKSPAIYTEVSVIPTESAATAYTVTGLTNGKTYAFTVAAGNSSGLGEHSTYSNVARG